MHRIIVSLAIIAAAAATAAVDATLSPEESARVIERIREKNRPYFEKYRGVESLREVVVREYDPKNNELVNTAEIVMRRKDYTYEKPEVTVISFRKNGVDQKPADHKERITDPVYPLFDEQGASRYDFRVTGIEKHEGIRCYRIEVSPRQNTERHVRAVMFYDAATLAPVYADGTLGKIPYPLKDFRMVMRMADEAGVPVARSITMSLRVTVPLFFDRRFVTDITVKENKPIPR